MTAKKRNLFDPIYQKATLGKRPSRRRMFRPAVISRLMRDPFGLWCDYHAPNEERVEESSSRGDALEGWSGQFEREWIRKNHPGATDIQPRFGEEAFQKTLKAMIKGDQAIVNAQVWALGKDMYGRVDLLVRDDSRRSVFGDYHYRIIQLKRAKKLRSVYSLQAAALNKILGYFQETVPSSFEIALHAEVIQIKYKDISPQLTGIVKKWKEIRDNKVSPVPHVYDATKSPWRVYANKIMEQKEDLTLLFPVDPSIREKIRTELKVNSISEIMDLPRRTVSKVLGAKLARSIYYAGKSFKAQAPYFVDDHPYEIKRNKRNLYFDFEYSDEMNRTGKPHVFLIGIWDQEKNKFASFLGQGAQDEEKIFKKFLRYVGDPNQIRLYHWGDHEVQQMKRISRSHESLAKKLDVMIEQCVDLYAVLKSAVYLPVPTYSLKRVAPSLGFDWRHANIGAFEAMIIYRNFLKGKDKKLMKKVVDYNEDDCKAMWHVDRALTKAYRAQKNKSKRNS